MNKMDNNKEVSQGMTTIQTHKGELLIVTVPAQSVSYSVTPTSVDAWDDNNLPIKSFRLTSEYELLGHIYSDGINFDCSEFVKLHAISRLGIHGWKDYVKTTKECSNYTCKDANESFITLLESNGIYLKNPMGDKYIALLKIEK